MKQVVFIIIFFSTIISIGAQSHFGIGGGVTFSSMEAKETTNYTSDFGFGFTIGGIYGYKFNRYLSINTGLTYKQKGGDLSFTGRTPYAFERNFITENVSGNRVYNISITTHELEIPIEMGFHPFRRIKIRAGGYIGILVASSASGVLEMTNVLSSNEKQLEDFSISLESNRLTSSQEYTASTSNMETYKINGFEYNRPTIMDIYTESSGSGKVLQNIDMGIQGGLDVFLSDALYLSGTYQLGLTPISKDNIEPNFRSQFNDENNFQTVDYNRYQHTMVLTLNLKI